MSRIEDKGHSLEEESSCTSNNSDNEFGGNKNRIIDNKLDNLINQNIAELTKHDGGSESEAEHEQEKGKGKEPNSQQAQKLKIVGLVNESSQSESFKNDNDSNSGKQVQININTPHNGSNDNQPLKFNKIR